MVAWIQKFIIYVMAIGTQVSQKFFHCSGLHLGGAGASKFHLLTITIKILDKISSGGHKGSRNLAITPQSHFNTHGDFIKWKNPTFSIFKVPPTQSKYLLLLVIGTAFIKWNFEASTPPGYDPEGVKKFIWYMDTYSHHICHKFLVLCHPYGLQN